MENITQVEGFVIRKQSYRESGYLVDLLTDHLGLIKILVRSRNQQKITASLELFTYGRWFLKSGRVFYFVHDYELIERFQLKGRLIWSGYYLNELIIRLSPKEQHDAGLFEYYARGINALCKEREIELALRKFESALLESLGIYPDLLIDQSGLEIEKNRFYYLTINDGISAIPQPQTLEIAGDLLHKIARQEPLNRDEANQYKSMMRFLLRPLLGDRPLQSRVWLQKLYYSS